MRALSLIGQRFGRLLVVDKCASQRGRTAWECLCECGSRIVIVADSLRNGSTKSCGCLRSEVARRNGARSPGPTKKHGLWGTAVYNVWKTMHQRCSSSRSADFDLYGGRGIAVCERWRDVARFVADMGPRPPGASLDRIDNDGNYEPGNCRWATAKQQANNRRPRRKPSPQSSSTRAKEERT